MARPIAELKRPLVRGGTESPLGGLVAEARRNALRADVGLVRTEMLKADLRKPAERTSPRLRRRIARFARTLTAREAANYFRHAGYE